MLFITQGKTNWKYIIIVVILAIIVGVGALWCSHNFRLKNEPYIPKSDLILFEKNEDWGPCLPDMVCSQTTKFYESGKLLLKGEKNTEKQLDKEIIEKIKNQIKSSGIMDKDCSGKFPLPDYSADYTLNFEGKINKILYPNCEEELKGIESIIEDETADWKTYRNEEIGVEFKYPIQYIEDTYKEEGAKGRKITAVFGPPGYFSFSFSAYTPDYEPPQDVRIFYDWTGTRDAVKNCPNPLEYESEYICKIIDISKEKGVFETILINRGNYCDLFTYVYFNNQSSSQYKGLNFELDFPDIISEVCRYLPWNITGGRNGFDFNKLESEFYSQYYSQARNLIESKNLSEKNTEKLKILYLMLSTFRFIE